MNTIRISKYNPKFRDRFGKYNLEEWSSISDIGKEFKNKLFTYDEYILVENNYISALKIILEELSLEDEFILDYLEKGDLLESDISKKLYTEQLYLFHDLAKEGMTLNKSEVLLASRLALREDLWFTIKGSNSFVLEFGYDYYMYVTIDNKIPVLKELIETQCNLFIEREPYF